MRSLRQWVHQRAHHGPAGHSPVSRQRKVALWLTIFAAVRVGAWTICMFFIIAHWLGAGGSFLHVFIATSSTVLFVTFISFYCNAATDLASLMAGIAALFSADSHATALDTHAALAGDFAELEGDIARLADLQPGPEATALATQIRQQLTARA